MTAKTDAERQRELRIRRAQERKEARAAGLVRLPDVWLPRWLAEWLSAQPGTRAGVIQVALCRAHKLREPPA